MTACYITLSAGTSNVIKTSITTMQIFIEINTLKAIKSHLCSCPMKMHHSSDVHSCCLSKALLTCVIDIYYIGQMQCFRTKISIPLTLLTHDVTPGPKLRESHFGHIQKDPKVSLKRFLFASRSTVISPQL